MAVSSNGIAFYAGKRNDYKSSAKESASLSFKCMFSSSI